MTKQMKFYDFEQTKTETKRKSSTEAKREVGKLLLYNFHWKGLLFAVIGFLLGGASIMENLYPCGIGWLAAMAVWDKRRLVFQTIPVILGTVFWSGTPLAYAAILLLLMFFLGIYTPPERKVRYFLPLTVFVTTLAVRGLFLLFTGISDLLLIVILVESILGAGLSIVFLTALETWQRFGVMERPTWEEILCTFLVVTGVIMGLSHILIFSMPLSEIAMRLTILIAALLGGVGGGASIGTLMGMIPALSGSASPSALGIFAFSGLVSGVFHKFGRLGVIVGFLAGNLVLTLYLLNTSLILMSVLASVISAILLLCIPNKLLFRGRELLKTGVTASKNIAGVVSDEYVSLRLKEAGQVLEKLRTTLSTAQEQSEEKEEKNMENILSHLSRTVCSDCGLTKICWESDFYETYRDILSMFAAVESRGVVYSKDVPNSFKKRCSHRKEFVATVNCLYEMYRKNAFWKQQTLWGRGLISTQLENTVHLLTNIEYNLENYVVFRDILDKKLTFSLRNSGFPVDYTNLLHVNEANMTLKLKTRDCKGNGCCGKTISNAIYDLTGRKFLLRDFTCGTKLNEACQCKFLLDGSLYLQSHSQQIAKGDNEIVGDSVTSFTLDDGKECFVLSDGMGVGEVAKKEADFTVSLIRDIMVSGFDENFAAGILNYLAMNGREDEVYATTDICLVDLMAKTAEFVKLGAAPSYICSPCRGVKVISGNSMPHGSSYGGKPKTFKENLVKDDIVVMISDGVLDTGLEDGEMEYWLTKTLNESQNEPVNAIAQRILSGAVAFCGGKAKDDMSITIFIAE